MSYLQDYLTKPREFERGICDCCRFAVDWAELRCGRPVGLEFKRKMTRSEAMRILAETSLVQLAEEALRKASQQWVRVEDLAEGAIALVKEPGALGGSTLGIVTNGKVVVLNEEAELVFLEPQHIIALWDCLQP